MNRLQVLHTIGEEKFISEKSFCETEIGI